MHLTEASAKLAQAFAHSWVEDLRQDLRYGIRQLVRNPAFAVTAILMLAIGIGANTAIFSVVNSMLLRALPYPDADRLAIILADLGDSYRAPESTFDLYQMRQRSREFDQIAGIWVTNRVLPGRGDPEQGKAALVTSNFLPLLCARPALGRFFGPEDDRENAPSTLILSHELWVRKFGADPRVIGAPVPLGHENSIVIGVLPPNFKLLFPEDASVPAAVDYYQSVAVGPWDPDGPAFLHLLGRLRPGRGLASAQTELSVIAGQINQLGNRTKVPNYRLHAFSLQDDDVRAVRPTLYLLFGGAGFILLIGCANVSNVLMVRARQRLREITVRAALGASSARLVRQILTETLLLVLAGGLVALPLGWAAVRGMLAFAPASFTHLAPVALDGRALAFTFAMALVVSVPVAVAPISLIRHAHIAEELQSGAKSTTQPRRTFAALLIAAEVALAFVLLVGAGLLASTFANLLKVDSGFRADHVFTLRVNVQNYEALREIQRSLTTLAGVRSVSAVSHLPLEDTGNWYDYYWKDGATAEQQNTTMTDMRSIMPGFFDTIHARLMQGRDFTESDDVAHQHVAIIDESLAKQLWPGQSPLGKRINVSDSPKGPYQFERDWLVVAGVVRHVQYHQLASAQSPQVYVPYRLAPRPSMSMLVQTNGNFPGMADAIRRRIASLPLQVPVTHVEPLSAVVDRARAESRFVSILASLFSLIGMQLAMGGIYGVLSYSVVVRTTEIGIRMAVGAERGDIVRLILREGLVSVGLGVGAGMLLAFTAAPLLSHLLFQIKPSDPAVYVAISGLILLFSTFAMLIPALRATRINPWTAIAS